MSFFRKFGIGLAVMLPPTVGMIAALTVTKKMGQLHYGWTVGCPKCDEEREVISKSK